MFLFLVNEFFLSILQNKNQEEFFDRAKIMSTENLLLICSCNSWRRRLNVMLLKYSACNPFFIIIMLNILQEQLSSHYF